MRAVIQRVSNASVQVDNEIVGEISSGLLVFLGIETEDQIADIDWLSNKIVNMRIFDDENGVMNYSVLQQEYDILLISQFTLQASTKKGNRPSYIKAAKPEMAEKMYENFRQKLSDITGKKIETGKFGADMKVALLNDGPVTIIIDSKNRT